MIAILLAIALTTPRPIPVDRIEINTLHCESGVMKQIILWRWTWLATGHGYRVADWWIVGNDYQPVGSIVSRYQDGRLQEITSKFIDATETRRDPELFDRKTLPQDDRTSYFGVTE